MANETTNFDFLNDALKKIINDERLSALIEELQAAIDSFKEDEKNTALRENLIFKQFADKLLTDSERAAFYNLPETCRMRENAKLISPQNLTIGEHVWIGEGAVLDASGGLEIGSHTSIGLGVFVWSHSSHLANIEMANYPSSPLITRTPTKIGSGVFIGGPSVINPGVTVGDRTIILPMSCVTKSFEGNCILGGSPAKIIKML